jgi:hypothetical protein
MKSNETRVTRRDLIIGAGSFAAGAALLSAAGPGFISGAEAKGTTKYPYKKLDLDEVGKTAYERYFTKFCANTTMGGIFIPLQKKVGDPYVSFPLDAITWAHGGIMGWGTACGTLIGAGMAIGLIAGEQGDPIINDVVAWYANNELPIYKPAKAIKADIKNVSKSDSPLCHISTGRWMKKEGVGFFTPERLDRCARVSADVAMHTAKLLNAWAEGKYTPANQPLANAKAFGLPVQNNCTDCHGSNIPKTPGA